MASVLTNDIDISENILINDGCLVDVLAYPIIANHLIRGQWNWRLEESASRNGLFKPFSAELTQIECVVKANLLCEPLSALDRIYELINGMFEDLEYAGRKFDTHYFTNPAGKIAIQISVRAKS